MRFYILFLLIKILFSVETVDLPFKTEYLTIALLPAKPELYCVVDKNKIFKSADSGKSWKELETPKFDGEIVGIFPTEAGPTFVSVYSKSERFNGLWRLDPETDEWSHVIKLKDGKIYNFGESRAAWLSVSVSDSEKATVYKSTDGALYFKHSPKKAGYVWEPIFSVDDTASSRRPLICGLNDVGGDTGAIFIDRSDKSFDLYWTPNFGNTFLKTKNYKLTGLPLEVDWSATGLALLLDDGSVWIIEFWTNARHVKCYNVYEPLIETPPYKIKKVIKGFATTEFGNIYIAYEDMVVAILANGIAYSTLYTGNVDAFCVNRRMGEIFIVNGKKLIKYIDKPQYFMRRDERKIYCLARDVDFSTNKIYKSIHAGRFGDLREYSKHRLILCNSYSEPIEVKLAVNFLPQGWSNMFYKEISVSSNTTEVFEFEAIGFVNITVEAEKKGGRGVFDAFLISK